MRALTINLHAGVRFEEPQECAIIYRTHRLALWRTWLVRCQTQQDMNKIARRKKQCGRCKRSFGACFATAGETERLIWSITFKSFLSPNPSLPRLFVMPLCRLLDKVCQGCCQFDFLSKIRALYRFWGTKSNDALCKTSTSGLGSRLSAY